MELMGLNTEAGTNVCYLLFGRKTGGHLAKHVYEPLRVKHHGTGQVRI